VNILASVTLAGNIVSLVPLSATHHDELACIAVEFRTNFMNQRSRAAIERLGARLDGVLRHHIKTNGILRDTCVYRILAAEWPAVRTNLFFRLNRTAA